MDSVTEQETVEAKVLVIKNSWKNCPPEQVYSRRKYYCYHQNTK